MQKFADANTWRTVPDLPLNHELFKATIVTHMFDIEDQKKFAYYIISCSYNEKIKWEVKRRYKQFETLAEILKLSFLHIPALPGKTLFSLTKDSDLDKRKEQLNLFLKGIINRKEMFSNQHFFTFLGISKYVPFLMTNFPIPITSIQNQKRRAYREAFFSLEDEFAVVGGHQVYVANRLDSYFSNFFKSDKKATNKAEVTSADQKSVGLVEFLRRVDKGQESRLAELHSVSTKDETEKVSDERIRQLTGQDLMAVNQDQVEEEFTTIGKDKIFGAPTSGSDYFNYQKVFDKAFKYQVISMAWSPIMNMFVVGLDSGDIYLLGYDVADNRGFTSEKCLEQVHTKRVMRICIDEKRQLIFSVGEDKKFACCDLTDKTVVCRLTLPGNKLTHLVIHKETKLAYTSDTDGNIFVVSVAKKYAELQQKINTLMKGPIRALVKVENQDIILASSGQDGMIKAFYNANIKESTSTYTCILQILGPSNARSMYYWKDRKELWVGYAKGVISVYGDVDFSGELTQAEVVSARESVTFSSPLHEGDINEIKILERESLLVSVAKDMTVGLWSIPENWYRSVKGYASEKAKYEHETEYLSDSEEAPENDD